MEAAFVLFIAFLIDILIGDPQYRCHPIRLIGGAIAYGSGLLKKTGLKSRGCGAVLALAVILSAVSTYSFTHYILSLVHPLLTLLFNIFACYSFLALKDLYDHLGPVVNALESNELKKARMAVGRVVGRHVACLDRSGVARAAVETMAENFVDGFLSPVFWYVVGCVGSSFFAGNPVFYGISLMAVFKVVSTLDSMVGNKREEFLKIGWAGARLDDAMNYIPARLSLVILFIASLPGSFHPIDGLRVALRDRLKHDSPNSAHPESFFAGALNIRLAGPIKYSEGVKDYPWLGAEYGDPDVGHIVMGKMLLNLTSWITVIITCVILFYF